MFSDYRLNDNWTDSLGKTRNKLLGQRTFPMFDQGDQSTANAAGLRQGFLGQAGSRAERRSAPKDASLIAWDPATVLGTSAIAITTERCALEHLYTWPSKISSQHREYPSNFCKVLR
jgi:hypothetical protein